MKKAVCVDIGSSSARVSVVNSALEAEEKFRVPHSAVMSGGRLRWDILPLFDKLKSGIAEITAAEKIDGIGICSWGVDYGVVGDNGVADMPYCYRDGRTEDIIKTRDGLEDFAIGGVYPHAMNTVYQLLADVKEKRYGGGVKICMIADLFAYFLTGAKFVEKTNASTTGLMNSDGNDWNREFAEREGINPDILPPLISAGDVYGLFCGVPVVAACTHDTASAIYSMGDLDGALFLSTGSWVLEGALTDKPVVCRAAYERGYTNERGFGDKVTLLKNTNGLYVLQCLQREMPELTFDFIDENIASANCLGKIDLMSLNSPHDMRGQILKQLKLEKAKPIDLTVTFYDNLIDGVLSEVSGFEKVLGRTFDRLVVTGGLTKSKYASARLKRSFDGRVETVSAEGATLGIAKVLLNV